MSSSELFSLKWNDFETNISSSFGELREDQDFFDVTLACDDDNQIQAHKVILSACSPFFRNILRRNSHQHPLLYLKGVKYRELFSVLNFMYMGEVSVAQEELNTFLSVAEDLRVKGLTQSKQLPAERKPIKPKQTQKAPDLTLAPKEPHTFPSTTEEIQRPRTLGKMTQDTSYSQDDNDIKEYTPVKTEPRDLLPLSFPVQSDSFLSKDDYQHQDLEMMEEEDIDKGTVVLDESNTVEEVYQTATPKIDTNKGKKSLNAKGKSKAQKPKPVKKEKPRVPIKPVGIGCNAWQCELCEKLFSLRKTALEHLEEDHQ